MFHKDTRRSDKFKRTVDHFKKNGQAVPTRDTKKEPEFTGYTEFLKSKSMIGPIDIKQHMKYMQTFTHFYSYPNKFYSEPRLDFNDSESDKDIQTEIHYERLKVIECAQKYRNLNMNKNVSLLNFASAKNPGGGFLRGSMAQEESIAYVSTLYHSLVESDMYEINKEDSKNGLYNDIAIYTSEICVFKLDRDDETYIEPFYVSVISCPAVNKLDAKRKNIEDTTIYDKMVDRIRLVLETAKMHKVDVLILGAFGCGVFGNDPKDIKEIFMGLIENEYENIFDKIIFTIPDDKTFERFTETL
jgi:uncharacterized protein (TIGR02452 family)